MPELCMIADEQTTDFTFFLFFIVATIADVSHFPTSTQFSTLFPLAIIKLLTESMGYLYMLFG